jgi:hypothetical protein
LAVQAPCITVFFDVGHALLERVAAFSAEEMSIVPIFTQSYHVLPNNWSLAVFASWSKVLMPVKMTIKP